MPGCPICRQRRVEMSLIETGLSMDFKNQVCDRHCSRNLGSSVNFTEVTFALTEFT